MRFNRTQRRQWQRDDTPPAESASGGGPATPPATPTANGNTPPANGETPPASLLNAPQTGEDWLPEKFRVNGADGKLDESASARKLAESYKALEAHKGTIPNAPATPEEYKLTAPTDKDGKPVEGIDVEAFAADPMFKGIAAKAHAAGLSNDQLNTMVGAYLELAPQLFAADKVMTADEAKAELGKVWKSDAEFSAGIKGTMRAIQAYGAGDENAPGSAKRLTEKYGADPDFIAFAANIAKEMKEDAPAGEARGGDALADADLEALMKSPAYWNANDPQHTATKQKVDAHFAKKHGTAARGRAG